MTTNELCEKTIHERIERTKELLLVKGKEYIRNNDPLHNFRQGAQMDNETMVDVLHGFLRKHLISYNDMRADLREGKAIDPSQLKEKIGDIIVYFHLQEVAFMEEILSKENINRHIDEA